jgi:hypothetical protein
MERIHEPIQMTKLYGSSAATTIPLDYDEERNVLDITTNIDLSGDMEFAKEWEDNEDFPSSETEDIYNFHIMVGFADKLFNNIKSLEPEVAKIVRDHFWDLL